VPTIYNERKTMRIYLDLDGVMADFDTHFVDHFGVDPQSLDDDVMWKMINGYHNFYANLPLMKDALELFNALEGENVTILTACPKSNYKNAAIQKRAWVRKHLSESITVIPMMGGVNKALFMHEPGDILIDDMMKNCKAWEELGGVAIVHKNAADTLAKLKEIVGA
jgi:5'-nucleotidase